MNFKWLYQNNSDELIVFFSGWGFDQQIVAALKSDCDVLFVCDYREIDTPLPVQHHYNKYSLIAWSFGVANYCLWQQNFNDPFTQKVAINGTLTPIDRHCGIAPKVLQTTIDTLSLTSHQTFVNRCCLQPLEKPVIDLDLAKQELIAIQQRDYSVIPESTLEQWQSIYLSRQDCIFPSQNLQRAWQSQAEKIIHLEQAHVPFNAWENWQSILA